MINVALQYKQAIHDITGEDELLNFVLTSTEWETLENLCNILSVRGLFLTILLSDLFQAFKNATLFFSKESATLATIIPATSLTVCLPLPSFKRLVVLSPWGRPSRLRSSL